MCQFVKMNKYSIYVRMNKKGASVDIRASGNTHTGMNRNNNEDAYGIFPELSLYIVADGLGGHAGGEGASRVGGGKIKTKKKGGNAKKKEKEKKKKKTK